MDALMSNIMSAAARVKRPAEDFALDLTKAKFSRQTCDSFIELGDLRSGTDSNTETCSHVKREPNDTDVFDYPCVTVSSSKEFSSWGVSSERREYIIQIKREVESPVTDKPTPHPFSIESLLGDNVTGSNSVEPTAPAVVYNVNTPRAQCTTFNAGAISDFHTSNFDGSYWCHACNELCTDYKNAQGHQYLHYMQGAKCNLKKALFYQHGYVSKHVKVDDERMKCGLCDKIVAQCFFTKHQRLHDGHFCDICTREFPSNSRLLEHMNIHTGSTPFLCKVCNRKFTRRSSLTQHQRYHRDHGSFKCGYCPKSFNSKYTRAVHERLHTGEKPFKCQVPGCKRAFPQKIQLQLHLNVHK